MQKTTVEVGTKNFSTTDKYCDTHIEYELQYQAVNGVRIPGFPKKEPVEACWYQTEYGSIGYANRLSRLYVKDESQGENVTRVTGQPTGLWASLGTSGYMMFQTSISGSYKRLNLYEGTQQRLTMSKTGWYDQYAYDGTTSRWTLPGFNGNPLGTNATGYSENGDWIVAETSHGFMRINTQTKDTLMFGALLFGYGYGQDPAHELTISNDGRYAVVAGGDINKRIFHMYDLATCVKGADAFAVATGCIKRDIKADVFPELANNKTVSRIIFGNDATDLTYNYQISDGTVNRTLLTAPGQDIHLKGYMAFGDSYSSGEGEYEGEKYYVKGTDADGRGVEGFDTGLTDFPYELEKCHVSKRAYPNLLGQYSDLTAHQYDNLACSGSVAFDVQGFDAKDSVGDDQVYTGKDEQLNIYRNNQATMKFLSDQALANFVPGRIPQIEFINKYKPEVVTLGIGGNDINFGGKLAECVMPGTCSSANELRHYTGLEIHNLHKKLLRTYKKLSEAGPTTRFYVVGYPQMVSQDDTCAENVRLNLEERILARSMTSYLNQVIKSAAESVGFTYLDIEYALAGEMLCDEAYGGKAAQGLTVGDDGRDVAKVGAVTFYIEVANESFHPTHIGHAMIAEAIGVQLDNSSIIEHRSCALLDGLRCPSGNSAAPPIPEYFTAYNANQTEYVVDSKSFDSIYYVDGKAGLGDGTSVPVQPPESNDGAEIKLAPNQSVPVTMHSTPQQVGNMIIDATGQVGGSITIPQGAEPGPHTLVINAKDSLYRDITMYQQIFVYDTLEDFDGDGVLNANEKCGMFEPINQDEDRDGVDDACDGIIGGEPDKTAPTITAEMSSQPNDAGWFNDDVTVSWSVTDDIDNELVAPVDIAANKEGEHTYTSAQVCDSAGNCATGSVTIKIDKTAPIMNGATVDAPNQNGWFNHDVTINWSATDNLSTVTNPESLQAVQEGEHIYESDNICDAAGNCTKGSVTIKIDKTSPTLTSLSFSKNPKSVSDVSQLSANINDDHDIVRAEYFIGETGNLGQDASMQINGSQATASFGTDYSTGVYKISVRAQDIAGNWSQVSSDYLVVYDPASGLRIHGARMVDLVVQDNQLPWVADQPTQGKFAFSVRYGNDGSIVPQSDFQFSYNVGNQCGSKLAQCKKVELNTTRINWLTTAGANQEIGVFSGKAVLSVAGVEQPVSFVVTARDGQRAGPVSNDVFALTVYDGENPYTSPLLYFVLPTETDRGNTRIKQ